MKNNLNNLTSEDLTKLKGNILNSLTNTFYSIGESIQTSFQDGVSNLPDMANKEFIHYERIKNFQNTFELLGIGTLFPSSECNQKYYSLHWTDVYYLLCEDARAQWCKRERIIIQKNLPLVKDLIAFQKERKNNEQDPIL